MERELQQVVRVAELPGELRDACESGLIAWQDGRFTEARVQLECALAIAQRTDSMDGIFHATHLLGCVAFDEGRYAESRALHADVLAQCEAIEFRGGMASSLFDIAMIDEAEGDLSGARHGYEQALACFEAGGYAERTAVVRSALERLLARI